MGIPRSAAAGVLLLLLLTGGSLAGCSGTSGSGSGDGGATPSTIAGGSMGPSPSSSEVPSLPGGPTPLPSKSVGAGAELTVTGQVEVLEIEGGCLVLRAQGKGYQLMGVRREELRPSETLTVRGRLRTDVLTTCQVGPVLEVIELTHG